MSTYFEDVKEFHTEMGFDVPVSPKLGEKSHSYRATLRENLIDEEYSELCTALMMLYTQPNNLDLANACKEACDLIYVVLGFFVDHGIDPGPIWDAVHESNIKKAGGPVCPDTGKRLKPEGWQKPDIQTILSQQFQNT